MSSTALFTRAQQVVPGGVHSPVRACKSVGGEPRFILRAQGPYVYDLENQQYIDYVGSYGPALLGHAHPNVVEALQAALPNGFCFGTCHPLEVQFSELVCKLIPSVEKIRFMNSGTEAAMGALRLARGYTGKNTIMKFTGCYHGASDGLLIKAGSGALTLGQPDSAGVSPAVANLTLSLPFNDIPQLEQAFATYGSDLAAVIIEAISGNMGVVPATPEFLRALRRLCTQYNTVLIIDEVMTGFRVHLQGAHGYYGITPDLTIYGKILGGGLPIGAVGGKTEIMNYFAPLGPVYQAGTLSSNPLTMAAGLATLETLIAWPNAYAQLAKTTETLCQESLALFKHYGVPVCIQSVPGMFTYFFTELPAVRNYEEACTQDTKLFQKFFRNMEAQHIHLAPSCYEAAFISLTHDDAIISRTLEALQQSLHNL